MCIPRNNLTLVCIWALVFTWIGGKSLSSLAKTFFFFFFFGLHWNSGKKVFQFWWKPFFLVSSLNLLTWKKNRSRGSSPPMLKIVQNWGKIANYPPHPQCSTKIGIPSSSSPRLEFFWKKKADTVETGYYHASYNGNSLLTTHFCLSRQYSYRQNFYRCCDNSLLTTLSFTVR